MRRILIDAPGAGQWILDRAGGVFNPACDHSFSTHRRDKILGGFVLTRYLGNSMTAHMAGDDPRWLSRELVWLVCDYVFNQLGCYKLLTGVRSDNRKVISMVLRGGWQLETGITDAYEPNVDMIILSMTASACRWLVYQPRQYRSNIIRLSQE